MRDLWAAVDAVADETRFSGVVRVDADARAYGMAHRACGTANTVTTRFATASAAKPLTALAVLSLVHDGQLELTTTARSVLGDDLPLIDDAVTVEHLLAHRSGIGDYLDEDLLGDVDEYVLAVPVHQLVTAEDYLAVLDGYPQKTAPGAVFAYNNGGYVVLALIAERVAGVGYHDLVAERVCAPAGMADTAFLRSDELPAGAALGYLDVDGDRTNVLHLPVRGVGDGGVYATAADVHAFWAALFAGRILPASVVDEMARPRSEGPSSRHYGLGFWLRPPDDAVFFEGADAGVSFRSLHVRSSGATYTVLSNTSDGAWPVARRLEELLLP